MTAVNLSTLIKKANKNNYAVAGLVVLGLGRCISIYASSR